MNVRSGLTTPGLGNLNSCSAESSVVDRRCPRRSAMFAFYKINLRMVAPLMIPALLFAESGMAVTRVDEAPSVTVRYYDLNLNSPEGVASLYGRIHAAALDVCKQAEGPQLVNRVLWSQWNECVAHAVA